MINILIYRQGDEAVIVARASSYLTTPARSWELCRVHAPAAPGSTHKATARLMCLALADALADDPEQPFG